MKIRGLLMCGLIIALLMVSTTGPTAADGPHPWPMYMGDAQRTGVSDYLGPQSNAIAWLFYEVLSSIQPVIGSDGTAYVNGHHLYAVDSDGNLKWKLLIQGVYSAAIGPDGTVYAFGLMNDYALFAVEPTGTIKWSFHLGRYGGPPIVGPDGVVYIGAGPLYAINPNGTLRWRNDEVSTGPPHWIAMMQDGTILVPETASLKAVDPDGTLKWRAGVAHGNLAVAPDSTIYVADLGLTAVNPDGTLRWKFSSPLCGGGDWRSISPLAIAPDGTVYYGRCGALHAVDPSGSLLWYINVGSNFQCRPVIGSDGTIYYAAGNRVRAIAPDGTVKWSRDIPSAWGGVRGASLGADGTLYVTTGVGSILAFRDLPPTCLETDTGTGTACFAPGQGAIEDSEALPVPANPPAGYTFPHGLFSFKVTGLTDGQAVSVNIELPSPVPAGTKWWKYHDGQWHDYNIPIAISGNTITIILTDGGVGDMDDIAGQITDPGGPGYPLSLGPTVGWEGSPVNKAAIMAPWIALLAAIAGASLLLLRRRQTQS